jgi:hypothetical protein
MPPLLAEPCRAPTGRPSPSVIISTDAILQPVLKSPVQRAKVRLPVDGNLKSSASMEPDRQPRLNIGNRRHFHELLTY